MRPWPHGAFGRHSEAELTEWARTLSIFRFCGAIGGHANDGDQLMAGLRYSSSDDLADLAAALGITLWRVPWLRLNDANQIPDAPRWQQPDRQSLGGVSVFVYAEHGILNICIAGAAGDPYSVTQADVDQARIVERLLEPVRHRVVDPPRDNPRCICPKYYPSIFGPDETAP